MKLTTRQISTAIGMLQDMIQEYGAYSIEIKDTGVDLIDDDGALIYKRWHSRRGLRRA